MIAHLSAGIGIETGVIEDDFGTFAGFHFLRAQTVFHQRQNFAAVRDKLAVAFEDSLRQFAIGRAGGRFRAAFPGGTSTSLFFGAGFFKTFHVEGNAGIARRIDHKVEWKTVGFVQMESGQPGVYGFRFPKQRGQITLQSRQSNADSARELPLFGFDHL